MCLLSFLEHLSIDKNFQLSIIKSDKTLRYCPASMTGDRLPRVTSKLTLGDIFKGVKIVDRHLKMSYTDFTERESDPEAHPGKPGSSVNQVERSVYTVRSPLKGDSSYSYCCREVCVYSPFVQATRRQYFLFQEWYQITSITNPKHSNDKP